MKFEVGALRFTRFFAESLPVRGFSRNMITKFSGNLEFVESFLCRRVINFVEVLVAELRSCSLSESAT